ncbi:MAG: YIP1 family protein [candidate division Zixibacteria bacterium]|nr:YIP1 family protein [candidate division Zixibacteria bacterium]
MQENVAAVAAAPPVGDLGFLARWAHIYFSPKKTFEAVKSRPFWAAPMILLVLLGTGFFFWTAQPRMKDALEKMRKNENIMNLPAERRQEIFEQTERQFKSPLWISVGTIIGIAYYFVVAGILFFVGNIIMGGEAGYGQVLGVFVYTNFIAIPEMLVQGLLGTAKGSMQTALSLAAFFPPDQSETLAYRLINGLDIFSIWFVSVLIIGMATVYNFKTGKVAAWILPLWILWKFALAALAGLGAMVGG